MVMSEHEIKKELVELSMKDRVDIQKLYALILLSDFPIEELEDFLMTIFKKELAPFINLFFRYLESAKKPFLKDKDIEVLAHAEKRIKYLFENATNLQKYLLFGDGVFYKENPELFVDSLKLFIHDSKVKKLFPDFSMHTNLISSIPEYLVQELNKSEKYLRISYFENKKLLERLVATKEKLDSFMFSPYFQKRVRIGLVRLLNSETITRCKKDYEILASGSYRESEGFKEKFTEAEQFTIYILEHLDVFLPLVVRGLNPKKKEEIFEDLKVLSSELPFFFEGIPL